MAAGREIISIMPSGNRQDLTDYIVHTAVSENLDLVPSSTLMRFSIEYELFTKVAEGIDPAKVPAEDQRFRRL